MAESRARRRIRLAVEAIGWDVLEMEWEPWGQVVEKSGLEGGWTIKCRRRSDGVIDYAAGYSVDDVLRFLPLLPEAPR